jgi:hypothetical protein
MLHLLEVRHEHQEKVKQPVEQDRRGDYASDANVVVSFKVYCVDNNTLGGTQATEET